MWQFATEHPIYFVVFVLAVAFCFICFVSNLFDYLKAKEAQQTLRQDKTRHPQTGGQLESSDNRRHQ